MDLGLTGRRAIVLAGTRGLGAACVGALADEGCRVVTCGRSGSADPRDAVTVHRADVADARELDGFLDRALDDLGGADVLVTNCGGPPTGTLAQLSDAQWTDACQAILLSVVRSCRRVAPVMAGQGGGVILCITSTSAVRPIPGLTLSNALRPAVIGLARTLAAEYAGSGIRVNCVLPGPYQTERSVTVAREHAARLGLDPGELLDRRTAAVPLGRLGDPAEFGRHVAFLAGSACTFTTGTTVVTDGGLTLAGPA
jgi:3-oxoacyl-[acyl-carrier protein] reductase